MRRTGCGCQGRCCGSQQEAGDGDPRKPPGGSSVPRGRSRSVSGDLTAERSGRRGGQRVADRPASASTPASAPGTRLIRYGARAGGHSTAGFHRRAQRRAEGAVIRRKHGRRENGPLTPIRLLARRVCGQGPPSPRRSRHPRGGGTRVRDGSRRPTAGGRARGAVGRRLIDPALDGVTRNRLGNPVSTDRADVP